MANPLLEFDPTSEDAANSPLEIWNTTSYAVSAFSAPAPPLTVQWAGSVDTEGSLPSSKKHENRTISITVDVLSAAALRSLQAKIGKVTREGGTLKLTLPASSEVVVFDLHSGDTFEPQLDIVYFVNSGAFCTVNLSLTAKPYGRGPSVTLTTHTATTKAPLVFTETGIKGDLPALGDLRIANATSQKTWLMWGQQSRYYDAGTTAALFLEAEGCQAFGAALNAGPAGASGSGNKVLRHATVGTTGAESFGLGTSGTQNLSHVGTFNVWARVQADSANTGIAKTQLWWRPGVFGDFTANDWISIQTSAGAAIKGSWVVVNLGQVSLPKARIGIQRWQGSVYSASTVAADIVHYDWTALVPVDEGAGVMRGTFTPAAATEAVDISDKGVLVSSLGGTSWMAPTAYEGDYLGGSTGIPPAGSEGRTLRMIVLFTGPTTGGNNSATLADADNIDAVTATLTYTPRYLVVPEP
jgi:hypothetical protein